MICRTFGETFVVFYFVRRKTHVGPAFLSGARSGGEGDEFSTGVADGVSSASGAGVGLAFLRFDLLFGVGSGSGERNFLSFRRSIRRWSRRRLFVECSRCLRVGVGLRSARRLSDSCLTTLRLFEQASIKRPRKITRESQAISVTVKVFTCPQRTLSAETQSSSRMR